LVLEVVKNYDVDGIQGMTMPPLRRWLRSLNRGTLPQNIQSKSAAEPQGSAVAQWRADILTDFLARLYQEVKAINQTFWCYGSNIYDWGLKNTSGLPSLA